MRKLIPSAFEHRGSLGPGNARTEHANAPEQETGEEAQGDDHASGGREEARRSVQGDS